MRTLAVLLAGDIYGRLPLPSKKPVGAPDASPGPLRSREVELRLRDGARIQCRLSDLGAVSSIYLDKDYDFATSYLVNPVNIIDIGAHVGVFTLWSTRKNLSSNIFSLEPNEQSFAYLARNISINGLEDRANAVNGAVGGKAGHGKVLARSTPLGSRVERLETAGASSTKIHSLEEILALSGFDRCNVLKMDCEGAEFEAILEAPDPVLESIDLLMCEYHPVEGHSLEELVMRLQGCGFRVTTEHTDVGMLWATRLP